MKFPTEKIYRALNPNRPRTIYVKRLRLIWNDSVAELREKVERILVVERVSSFIKVQEVLDRIEMAFLALLNEPETLYERTISNNDYPVPTAHFEMSSDTRKAVRRIIFTSVILVGDFQDTPSRLIFEHPTMGWQFNNREKDRRNYTIVGALKR